MKTLNVHTKLAANVQKLGLIVGVLEVCVSNNTFKSIPRECCGSAINVGNCLLISKVLILVSV